MINKLFFVIILVFSSILFSSFNFNQKISDYNIYEGDPRNLITTSNYFEYEIKTPLFTDYA